MVRARRWLLGLAAGCTLSASVFEAAAGAEAIRVSYSADPGCPEQTVFAAELAARTSRVRPAEPDEPARAVDVAISWTGSVAQGLLVISGPGASSTRREVTGNDCAEVVSALALVAALVIDPRASTEAQPPLASSTAVGTPSEGSPVELEQPQPAGPSEAAPSPPSGPRLSRDQPPHAREEPRPGQDQKLLVGAAGHALFGPAPRSAFGAGAFLGFDDARPRLFAVAGRASVLAATSSATFPGGVGARFTWILLRPELCPFRPVIVDSVRLELCSFFDVGLLDTQGKDLDHTDRSARVWLAPGALGRASWELGRRLIAEVAGGISLPLRRYPFEYDPGSGAPVEVYTVPVAAGTLSIGAAYRFP